MPVSRGRRKSPSRRAKPHHPPASPQQRLIREVNRAARTDNALQVELAFGRVAAEMSEEELEETLILAVDRHAPGDALVAKVIARLGGGTVRELAAGLLGGATNPDPELPWWVDVLGVVHVLGAHRLTTEHRDMDVVWLEFAFPGDRWPHVVGLGIQQVLGGVESIEVEELASIEELPAWVAHTRAELESVGYREAPLDEDYVCHRLPYAYRGGLEMVQLPGDETGWARDWILAAHRLTVYTGVDVDAVPWPPENDLVAVERMAVATAPHLEGVALTLDEVTECLRWVFAFTMDSGGRDPAVLAPETVTQLLDNVLAVDGFTGTSLAPRLPEVLRALVDWLAQRDDWSGKRRSETLKSVSSLQRRYLRQCITDFGGLHAKRVENYPDVDFHDSAEVRRWNFTDWPTEEPAGDA